MSRAPEFRRRREYSDAKIVEAARALSERLSSERGQRALVDTCIYATGSAGRGELAAKSDLDLFFVRVGDIPKDKDQRQKHRLDQMVLQGAIVEVFEALKFEEPSNGGKFLELHTSDGLRRQLGDTSDDHENTFTARMLLLLESRVLVGHAEHERLIDHVLDVYWENSQSATTTPTPSWLPLFEASKARS